MASTVTQQTGVLIGTDDAVATDRRDSSVPTEATGMIGIGADDFPIGNEDSKR
jgi:hypothetical protein